MSSATIQCDIVSAHQELFSGEVTMFVAAGRNGELGITPRHAPLITTLKPGPVRVMLPDGEEVVFFADGGILEVVPHLITVLTDTAIRADDLDQAATQSAREAAERELRDRTSDMEFLEAQAKLAKALAQLKALEAVRKRAKIKR